MVLLQSWILTRTVPAIGRLLILRDRVLLRIPQDLPPDSPGVGVSSHILTSGSNHLDARFVSPTDVPVAAALLICHGVGETVAHWRPAQTVLAQDGVASLVFNYSGYGSSTGSFSQAQCELDASVAFHFLQERVRPLPVSILGFSLGSGVATAIAAQTAPRKLILCAAFTSLRKAAASLGVPTTLTRLLPPIWDNVTLLKQCQVSLLVVHGDADRLFPPCMAQQLASACKSECEVLVIPRLTHNEPVYRPQPSFWRLITSRL